MTAAPGQDNTAPEEPRPDPIALARELHARFRIEKAREIEVELLAWHCGAVVLWRPAGSADARVVASGSRAYLAVAEEARCTPRARFSVAHELGHWLMHKDLDAIARIHGAPRTESREFRAELEADRFSSELVFPERLVEPVCARIERPSLEHVGALATEYRVSLTVSGVRWPTMTRAACAFYEARAGVIRRVVRSEAFRGVAVGRRKLEEGTLAAEMLRAGTAATAYAKRVHEDAWGSRALGVAIVEECVPAVEGVVLGWLWHERPSGVRPSHRT